MNIHRDQPSPASEAPAEPLSTQVLSALARKPEVHIPADFAKRVTRDVFAQEGKLRRGWLGWGPRLAWGSAALLTLGMFALAPHATPSLSNLSFDGQLLLLTELSALLLFSRQLLAATD